jgi:hypothetical protein
MDAVDSAETLGRIQTLMGRREGQQGHLTEAPGQGGGKYNLL